MDFVIIIDHRYFLYLNLSKYTYLYIWIYVRESVLLKTLKHSMKNILKNFLKKLSNLKGKNKTIILKEIKLKINNNIDISLENLRLCFSFKIKFDLVALIYDTWKKGCNVFNKNILFLKIFLKIIKKRAFTWINNMWQIPMTNNHMKLIHF